MGRLLLAAAGLSLLAAISACSCPPDAMTGTWGGIKLTFVNKTWTNKSKSQGGSITADTSGSPYAALGAGVGAWSGGYHVRCSCCS